MMNMINLKTGTVSLSHKYLDSMGNLNKRSVQNLPQEVRDFLRSVTPARLKELAQMNCFAADKVKRELDKKYGTNNYTLIAVGRSISSIAELMDKMGVDTKIIPMSGLRRCEVDTIPKDKLRIYKSFLAQIGLSKNDLKKNKNRKYILMDYAYYGRSLKRTEELLKKDEMLGNAKNLISMPINDILGEDYTNKQFRTLFQYNRFKDYSYVGKLHVSNLQDVFNQCSPEKVKKLHGNITQGLRKLFWFNVFDSLKEKDFKNIMPMKELNAIYEHHLSPRAIRNYLIQEFGRQQKSINDIKT